MTSFADRVLDWYSRRGRHDLPWQQDPSPYRVWISEIMLQQTQVKTVIPYYLRFMERFPTVTDLARAKLDQVLYLWTGLGYYARASNLHAAAKTVVAEQHGHFPGSVEGLMELPGIGKSTAGAILALALNTRAPILDANVKRVLTRFHKIEGWPGQAKTNRQLWDLAESKLPERDIASYTQAMMDLGATVCTRSKPICEECPLYENCAARSHNLTASIPGKKPRKALPVKSVAMFILQNDAGEVLLEKRPPNGIWGSLWSLPEAADPKAVIDLQYPGLELEAKRELTKIRHSFTHFHLEIIPVHLYAREKTGAVMDSQSWLWYPLNSSGKTSSREIGLAAPVKELLSTLAQSI
ncbi:MAG TPA: adenine DNA glycosylase [Porticoccaceae bacterium]|nr:adenine DNA glycosylase [Porticoccaceae bacterium]